MGRLLAAEVLVSFAVFALQEVPRGHGVVTLGYVVAVAVALPFLLSLARQDAPPPQTAARRVVGVVLAAFVLGQLGFGILRIVKPKIIDIGETTFAAVQALAHGVNPYALALDPLAGGGDFHGYKYLPMMMAAYAPFVLMFGIRGIVVANVILQGATAAAVGALAARGGAALAGLAAAAFYLSLPFPAFQVLARGVNDLVPVLPLLVALLLVERRPFWSGVLVGLSIAAKLMPGLAALPCLVPAPGGRWRYAVGVLVGLAPILPFAAAAADPFFGNIVLFNAVRPIDDTSWLLGMPVAVVMVARAAAVVALVALAAVVWMRPPDLGERCAAVALAVLLVFAVGPDMHHNYYLWFIPFMTALAGRAAVPAFQPGGGQRMEGAR
jgi:hypothetical protein